MKRISDTSETQRLTICLTRDLVKQLDHYRLVTGEGKPRGTVVREALEMFLEAGRQAAAEVVEEHESPIVVLEEPESEPAEKYDSNTMTRVSDGFDEADYAQEVEEQDRQPSWEVMDDVEPLIVIQEGKKVDAEFWADVRRGDLGDCYESIKHGGTFYFELNGKAYALDAKAQTVLGEVSDMDQAESLWVEYDGQLVTDWLS